VVVELYGVSSEHKILDTQPTDLAFVLWDLPVPSAMGFSVYCPVNVLPLGLTHLLVGFDFN